MTYDEFLENLILIKEYVEENGYIEYLDFHQYKNADMLRLYLAIVDVLD